MTKDSVIFNETLPEINDYWNLFQTTGWNKRYQFTPDDLERAIKNSWHSLSIFNNKTLIGFGRIISDGIHHAFIVDLIIHPDFQRKGIGSQLLQRLIKQCKDSNLRDIQLFSAKDKCEFYEKFGFEKRSPDAPGMQLK